MKLIPNPCKSVCKIKNGVCVGCHRTEEEIDIWPILTNEEKKIIIDRIKNTKDNIKDIYTS